MSEQDFDVEEHETTITEETLVEEQRGIPVLPLRDVVVYPHMVIPLFVGREKSIVALDRAMSSGKKILLIAQQAVNLSGAYYCEPWACS